MKTLLTAEQLAAHYGVSVKTINSGAYSWVKRGIPVDSFVPAKGGKEARLFDLSKVEPWHAENVAGRRSRTRRGFRASLTRNGRILLSADLVRELTGKDPTKGLQFAVAAWDKEVRICYAPPGRETMPSNLVAVGLTGIARWVDVLTAVVVGPSTYLRVPVSARREFDIFRAEGRLKVTWAATTHKLLRLEAGKL